MRKFMLNPLLKSFRLNAFAPRIFLLSGALFWTTGGFLTGCVHEVEDSVIQLNDAAASDAKGAVIVGALNWNDVNTLAASSDERMNANAVGYLDVVAKGSRCTAFLVANDVVMTNEHCIASSAEARGATVSFRRETGVSSRSQSTYSCGTFIGADANLDYALLRCEGNPGERFGVLSLNEGTPRTDDSIYILHQNCDYYSDPWCDPTKKISRGNLTRTGGELQYNGDTLGGSSGSPVFDARSHNVIGLHHIGIGGNQNGRGSANSAVRIDSIIDHIEARWPDFFSITSNVAPVNIVNDDVNEPNNDRNNATEFRGETEFLDLNISSDDVDMFRIDVVEESSLRVDVRFLHAQGDLDVAVYLGESMVTAATAASADDNEMTSLDVSAGTVYVVVYGYEGAVNDYSIAFSVQSRARAGDAPPAEEPVIDEPVGPSFAEPNDGPTYASDLPLPGAASGVEIGTASDVDFYRIQHAGGALLVQLDFVNEIGDLDLTLYSGAGALLNSSESITDQEVIRGNYPAGSYLVRVLGYAGAMGGYSLVVSTD